MPPSSSCPSLTGTSNATSIAKAELLRYKYRKRLDKFTRINELIFDADAQLVVGGDWIDKGALWTFNVRNHEEAIIPVEGAKFLSLRSGAKGYFRLVHHQSPDQAVSIRHIQEPGVELASVRLMQGRTTFLGDTELWRHVDPAFIIRTDSAYTDSIEKIILIDAARLLSTELDMSWWTNAYDHMYQSLIDCITLRARGYVIVSVQRSSTLVVIDPSRSEPVGSIALTDKVGDHPGNPQLELRSDTELFASNYDTLCVIDTQSLAVMRTARLQDAVYNPVYGLTRTFIGNYDISSGQLVVARPFSGDVLLLDPDDFRKLGQSRVGGQPLAVCMLSDHRVITREWKTGRVAIGEF